MKKKKRTYSYERCRHERNSWVIGADETFGEWCYVCGAYRGLRITDNGYLAPRTNWVKPTGNRDDNPYEKMRSKWNNKGRETSTSEINWNGRVYLIRVVPPRSDGPDQGSAVANMTARLGYVEIVVK